MPGDRPLKYQSVQEFESKIEAYFKECDREEDTCVYKHGETFEWGKEGHKVQRCKQCRGVILDEYGLPTQGCILVSGAEKLKTKPTITGLALWLDCDKETIRNYRELEEFSSPIKNAYLRVEREHEEELEKEKGTSWFFNKVECPLLPPKTGEGYVRHRLTDAAGRVLEDHPRPEYKPRVGEVDE